MDIIDEETLRVLRDEIEKHPLMKPDTPGSWCDIHPEYENIVVFYRADNTPFMEMPLELYDIIKEMNDVH